MELINENAMSLATNISIVVTVPAVSAPGLILYIAKLIDETKWCCSYTELTKNVKSVYDTKY